MIWAAEVDPDLLAVEVLAVDLNEPEHAHSRAELAAELPQARHQNDHQAIAAEPSLVSVIKPLFIEQVLHDQGHALHVLEAAEPLVDELGRADASEPAVLELEAAFHADVDLDADLARGGLFPVQEGEVLVEVEVEDRRVRVDELLEGDQRVDLELEDRDSGCRDELRVLDPAEKDDVLEQELQDVGDLELVQPLEAAEAEVEVAGGEVEAGGAGAEDSEVCGEVY